MDRQRRGQSAVAVRTRLTENRGGCQARPPVTDCRLLRRLGGTVCAPESAAIRSRWDTSYRSGQTPAWPARYPYVSQARGVAAECTDGRTRVLAVGVRWLLPNHLADAAEPPTGSGSTASTTAPDPPAGSSCKPSKAAPAAAELNRRGVRNRTGKPWSGYTIARILDNPAYAGDLAYRDVYVTVNAVRSSRPPSDAVQRSTTRRRAPHLLPRHRRHNRARGYAGVGPPQMADAPPVPS